MTNDISACETVQQRWSTHEALRNLENQLAGKFQRFHEDSSGYHWLQDAYMVQHVAGQVECVLGHILSSLQQTLSLLHYNM